MAAQPVTDFRVLRENATSIVIEFVPSFANRVVSGADGKRYTLYDFRVLLRTGARLVRLSHPTGPRSFTCHRAGFPCRSSPRTMTISRALLAASQPSWKSDKEFGLSPVYGPPNPRYATYERVPQQIAKLVDPRESRGMTLGTLKISPIQVVPAKNEVRLYRRIVVQIDFSAASPGGLPISAYLKGVFPSNGSKWCAGEKAKMPLEILRLPRETGIGWRSAKLGCIRSIRDSYRRPVLL